MSTRVPGWRIEGQRYLAVVGVALAATWMFWPALHGGWLWDDGLEIAHNPMLRDPSGWWKAWVAPVGMDYFPLKGTLQWLEWRRWGDQVADYHVVSLALHILSALLIWRVLGRLFALGSPSTSLGTRASGAWLGGLLFAVHPATVESVAWISEQKNTLSLPLLLLAMSAYIEYDNRWSALSPTRLSNGGVEQARWGQRAPPCYWLSLGFFLLAMLCKSTVVMFPVVLLLYAWWRRGRIGWSDLRASAPFFAVSLVLGLVTWEFQRHRAIGIGGPMPGFGSRLEQAGWSIAAYFREGIFPSGLMPIYPRAGATPLTVIPWLGLAAALGLGWARRATWGRHVLFGLGWFLLNLVPVLGFLPMSYLRVAPRADHFVYLSLAGLAGLAAAGFGAGIDALGGAGNRLGRAGLWGAAAVAVAALAATGRAYAAVFRDEGALWGRAVQCNPGAWLARNNLGRILLDEGRLEDAARQFEEAARIEPDSAEVHANLGNAYAGLGKMADARGQYGQALHLDPDFAGAHYDLGRALLQSADPAGAADEFRTALHLDPADVSAHNNLGLALARLGRLPEAIDEYELALRLDPDRPEAHLNLGNALFRQGRLPEAIAQYRAALRADPGYAPAHQNLGRALQWLGRDAEARAEFEAAERPPAPPSGQ